MGIEDAYQTQANQTPDEQERVPEMPNYLERYKNIGTFEAFLGSRQQSLADCPAFVVDSAKAKLQAQGVGDLLRVDSLPPYINDYLDHFETEDWNYIKESSNPLMAIYAVTGFYRGERAYSYAQSIDKESASFYDSYEYLIDTYDRNQPTPGEIGALGRLPLVYGTNLDTLCAVMDSGSVLSDRENHERVMKENKDSESQYSSNTHPEDRAAGLDAFVFTHFGKPMSAGGYGQVEILFKPDRLLQDQKAFATVNDFMDIDIISDEERGQDKYRDQILQGEYFYRAASRYLKRNLAARSKHERVTADSFLSGRTDLKDQYGGTTFSTWEVKLPRLTTEEIDSVVFRSIDDLQAFRERYPDTSLPLRFCPAKEDVVGAVARVWEADSELLKILHTVKDRGSGEELLEALTDVDEDLLEKVCLHFGTDVVLRPLETYMLSKPGGLPRQLEINELNRGGAERVRRVAELGDAVAEIYVEILSGESEITQETNIYTLTPRRLFNSRDEAVEWIRSKQLSNDRLFRMQGERGAFGKPGIRQEAEMRIAKVRVSAVELEKWKSHPYDKEEESRIKTYVIDGVAVLNGNGSEN